MRFGTLISSVCSLAFTRSPLHWQSKNATEYYKWMRLWVVTPSICCFAWETKNNEPLFFCSLPFARSLRASVASRYTMNCEKRTLAIRTKQQLGRKRKQTHRTPAPFSVLQHQHIIVHMRISYYFYYHFVEWSEMLACQSRWKSRRQKKHTSFDRGTGMQSRARANKREIGECETATATVTAAEKRAAKVPTIKTPSPPASLTRANTAPAMVESNILMFYAVIVSHSSHVDVCLSVVRFVLSITTKSNLFALHELVKSHSLLWYRRRTSANHLCISIQCVPCAVTAYRRYHMLGPLCIILVHV